MPRSPEKADSPDPGLRDVLDGIRSVVRSARDAYDGLNGSPLSRRQYPMLAEFERGIVSVALNLFGAPGGVGDVTSGGTESLFLALKAARDHRAAIRPVSGVPQVVMPSTAHLALDKVAAMLGIEAVRVPFDRETMAVAVDAVAAAITPRTIMLVGSAPSDPLAIFDPIERLAALALERGLWFHVDACIGGYFAPFARKAEYEVPAFDFAVPGVTSISADLHKFGYAPLGVSTVLYRDPEYHRYQGYSGDDWQFEPYHSNTFRGTFDGAPVAAAWAVLKYLGEEGYVTLARAVLRAKERLVERAARIPGVRVNEWAALNVFSYSVDGDIDAVVGAMAGWEHTHMRTWRPDTLQVYVVPANTGIVDVYLGNLREAVRG
jgi:glutamate/tyrosine decarboxylase-like PLP-dependent enzyme